LLLEYTDTSYE
nr:mouse glutathione S-transferase homolog peptide 36/37-4 [hamsters, Chinese hamster ovary cells, Peptide Partial, 11 aa] [Cricetinae]